MSLKKGVPYVTDAAFRGKPEGRRTPTSVVVPPTSITIVELSVLRECSPARYEAPRMEFVGPLEKVRIGVAAASGAEINVPSS